MQVNYFKRGKQKDKFSLLIIKAGFAISFFATLAALMKLSAPKWFYQQKIAEEASSRYEVYKVTNESIQQVSSTIEHLSKEKSEKVVFHLSAMLIREIVYTQKAMDQDKLPASNNQESSQSTESFDKLKFVRVRRSSSNQPYHTLRDDSFFDNQELNLHELLLDALDRNEMRPFHRQFNSEKPDDFPKNSEMSFEEKLELESKHANDNFIIFSKAEQYCQNQINAMENSTKNSSSESALHEGKNIQEPKISDNEHNKCDSEIQGGMPAFWTILYIVIVLCLFIGLAIICDEFFVPSLEAISEKLNLSEDVAGATFMAAGSSAPELFTSIAGMGTGSDVGVGTIVGSAVFNLLVIIALTSSLCGRVLQLDWRPLVRDSIFYGLSIAVFILFSWDAVFEWWESLGLLLLYALYIVTMKFNSQLMAVLASLSCCGCFEANTGRISPDQIMNVEMAASSPVEAAVLPANLKTAENVNTNASPLKSPTKPTDGSKTCKCVNRRHCCCCYCCGSSQKTCGGVVGGGTSLKVEASFAEDSKFSSMKPPNITTCVDTLCEECSNTDHAEVSFKEESSSSKTRALNFANDANNSTSSNGSLHETDNLPSRPPSPPPPYDEVASNTRTRCRIEMTSSRCHCNSNTEKRSRRTRIVGPAQICCCCFSRLRENRGVVIMSEIMESVEIYQEAATNFDNLKEGSPINSSKTVQANASDVTIASNETLPPSIETADVANNSTEGNDQDEGRNDILVVFPCLPPIRHNTPEAPSSSHCAPSARYILEWIIYIISFPWICAFTWTVPDCSKSENRKWFLFSFAMSIGWIAAISYVMVEVVEKIGCLLSIDNYTMGLVVIAIGTSVPDAISSILVAKAGHGDMAVSNAIGSNVFDINLGLGLPFFLSSLITGKPVNLLTSLQQCLLDVLPLPLRVVPHVKFGLILLLILLLCLVVFVAVRFRLSKAVGYLFVSMYIIFMIYAFIQEKSCYGFFC